MPVWSQKNVGSVIGFVFWNRTFFECGFVGLIVVAASHRRRGVGLRLLREVEARCAPSKLFTSANASNGAAQALFGRAGFARSGVIENLDRGDPEIVFFKAVREGPGRMGLGMRPANADDTQTLVDLMAEFYAESGYVLDRPRAADAFSVLLADPRLGRVWLIEREAAVVGYVVLTFVSPWSTAGSRRSSTTSTSGRPFAARAPAGGARRGPRVQCAELRACGPCRPRWAARTPPPSRCIGAPASS